MNLQGTFALGVHLPWADFACTEPRTMQASRGANDGKSLEMMEPQEKSRVVTLVVTDPEMVGGAGTGGTPPATNAHTVLHTADKNFAPLSQENLEAKTLGLPILTNVQLLQVSYSVRKHTFRT